VGGNGTSPKVAGGGEYFTVYTAMTATHTQSPHTIDRDAGVAPNVISFNAAISACGKSGRWERALSLLDEMRDAGRWRQT